MKRGRPLLCEKCLRSLNWVYMEQDYETTYAKLPKYYLIRKLLEVGAKSHRLSLVFRLWSCIISHYGNVEQLICGLDDQLTADLLLFLLARTLVNSLLTVVVFLSLTYLFYVIRSLRQEVRTLEEEVNRPFFGYLLL